MAVQTIGSRTDDTAELLESESKRLGKSAYEIVRDAVDQHLGSSARDLDSKLPQAAGNPAAAHSIAQRKLPFESLGVSGDPLLSQRVDEILRAEWGHGDARSR
jgi:hypothetical protein